MEIGINVGEVITDGNKKIAGGDFSPVPNAGQERDDSSSVQVWELAACLLL